MKMLLPVSEPHPAVALTKEKGHGTSDPPSQKDDEGHPKQSELDTQVNRAGVGERYGGWFLTSDVS